MIFSDILEKENLIIDKKLSYVFSILINMANEIIECIEKGEEPEDKIFEIGGLGLKNCNLIYRCCNICLTDSNFLNRNEKNLREIIIISRIIKNLEMIIKILNGFSYMINTKRSETMKKYHYPAFKYNQRTYKIISSYMKRWKIYMKNIKNITMKKDSGKATELYEIRFKEKIGLDEKTADKHLQFVITLAEMLDRNSSGILRDAISF